MDQLSKIAGEGQENVVPMILSDTAKKQKRNQNERIEGTTHFNMFYRLQPSSRLPSHIHCSFPLTIPHGMCFCLHIVHFSRFSHSHGFHLHSARWRFIHVLIRGLALHNTPRYNMLLYALFASMKMKSLLTHVHALPFIGTLLSDILF